ncbi:unnamed protein product [Brassica rapa subsp. trilocularis]
MKTIKFKEFIQQFRHHGSSTSDEVHHAIFKASKLLHGDDELLMPKEEVESLFDAYEDSDFRRSGSING